MTETGIPLSGLWLSLVHLMETAVMLYNTVGRGVPGKEERAASSKELKRALNPMTQKQIYLSSSHMRGSESGSSLALALKWLSLSLTPSLQSEKSPQDKRPTRFVV